MLSVGSLFSGIGGFDVGLERAGMRVLWQCDSDPFARRVLARHWADVHRYEDVCAIDRTAPQVDVLAGGFPCQDLSVLGGRAGLSGAKSGLWREFARLIRDLRPRYVLVENVTDLLVRGHGTVLADLAACGYDAEWDCVPAAAVGAVHLRARVWLLAYPAGGRHGAPQEAVFAGRGLPELCGWWTHEPGVPRVDDGVPDGVDRRRALGNALIPQIAEWIGRRIVAYEAEREELAA